VTSIMKKNRFEILSVRGKSTIVIIFTIVLLLILEFLARGTFYLYDKEWGYPSKNFTYLPYLTFFNSPLRKQISTPNTSPFFLKDKYSTITATDKYGFALDSNDNPDRDLSRKSECQYRVFMLGGSTVDGRFLSSEDDTLAARLENLLKEEHPDINFQVINAGAGAHYSAQEVALHLFYIGPSSLPNHIIYFDGSNDFLMWPRDELPGLGGNMHPYTNQLFRRAKSINTMTGAFNLLFQRLSNWSAIIYALHKGTNYPAKLQRLLGMKDRGNRIGPDEWISRHLDRYFYNMGLALNAANENTLVSYFLQPTLLPETPASQEELVFMKDHSLPNGFHGYNYFDNKQKFFTRARSMFQDLKKSKEKPYTGIHDLSLLFSSKKNDETVFGDHVHYLPRGREVISKAIFDAIEPQLKEKLSSYPFINCYKNAFKLNRP
jgi:hypothetical protein